MSSALVTGDGERRRELHHDPNDESSVSADQLVELLGDDYTRRVLEMIADEPMGGREITEATSISRPTVYRRLNQLEDAGLVDTTMVVCSDGHHHKQYRAILETANLTLEGDGLAVSVQTEDAPPEPAIGLESIQQR